MRAMELTEKTALVRIVAQILIADGVLSDSERIADNIGKAGGSVKLEVWPGMWHVFQVFVHQMPESREALRKIAPFVRTRLGVSEA